MTVADIVNHGARTLKAHSDSPRLDAELLLGQILGLPRASLAARPENAVSEATQQRFARLLARRAAGEPIAYLLGTREFWSLPLRVTPAVLVPRPETELLVERALSLRDASSALRVLDLGTGSGAIALALAAERPGWRLTAVDISAAALKVAIDNARALHCSGIDFRCGSWFDAVPGLRFDVIVGNPPYVAAGDPALDRLRAEPALALASGPTGLEALSAITMNAGAHLHAHGTLLLEHGHTQAAAVAQLLARHGFSEIHTHIDFSGKPRVTQGTLHPQRGIS
jgi:release factor glutamine methyltransferase